MPAVSGRSRREASNDMGYVPLQGRVPVEARVKANRAAAAAGISLSRYLEMLVMRDAVDADGCPDWLPPKLRDQPALPITAGTQLSRKTA